MRNDRIHYTALDLKIKSEPLLVSLAKYDMAEDRWPDNPDVANLISSRIDEKGKIHKPILDLDIPIRLEPSSTPGHHHLYIDVDVSWPRYAAMLTGLYLAGVIEMGFWVWSLRRKGTFVRKPGIKKTDSENTKSEYGWVRKYR